MVGQAQVVVHRRKTSLLSVVVENVYHPQAPPLVRGRRERTTRQVHQHAWLAVLRLAASAKVVEGQGSSLARQKVE
jgi:hypothetical protein